MSSNDLPPYILQELPDITEAINYPIKNVQRVKYTCFDISKTLIAFGATSGGIYIFNRTPCEFVQLIPSKDGTITRLSISANEKHIAFANGRGMVMVTECAQSLCGAHSSFTSKEHQGNEITAMIWSGNILFCGDDVGRVSVFQLPSFIAKTMFQSSSLTIMSLDSRICQLDVKDCMLLVSTLTRCYICDTSQEQYRQIGQKLRDGEFGACFVNKEKAFDKVETETVNFTEAKQYNIVEEQEKFAIGKGLDNVLIYCARPSSRLWEATVDGTVKRTHQFKNTLAKNAMKVLSKDEYNTENFTFGDWTNENDGQSINFSKIYNMNGAIFSFKKDALYFLDIQDETYSVWFDSYNNIVDSRIYHDNLYLWLSNGSLVSLSFMKIEKFLLKCYIDEKYNLCAELCALFSGYLLRQNISPKLHILVGLNEKISNNKILEKIDDVLKKFETLKATDASKKESGIVVLDNTFHAQTSLDDNNEKFEIEYKKYGTLGPETLQTLRELRVSLAEKVISSKKILKEQWEDFEDKMKHLNPEKQPEQVLMLPRIQRDETAEAAQADLDNGNIVYKESSHKKVTEVATNGTEDEKVCKSLYHYYRLNKVDKDTNESKLINIIENYSCDIRKIYQLMLSLKKYCISVQAYIESSYVPNNIFISYLNCSSRKSDMLKIIAREEALYKYFVDSCIVVNKRLLSRSHPACPCGFPVPYAQLNKTPDFSELIDAFIEEQWAGPYRNQCYVLCKKMPHLWKNILLLRQNEDMENLLKILLQMVDENLLNYFLPQFTIDVWDKAIPLYATLYKNVCLNCNKEFERMTVRDLLSWDKLGILIIKSVGGKNAMKLMAKNASSINRGDLSLKFHHLCLIVSMFEKHDPTLREQLTDALNVAYKNSEAFDYILRLLRDNPNGEIKNTALPLEIAARSPFWVLIPPKENTNEEEKIISALKQTPVDRFLLDNFAIICHIAHDCTYDCLLCGVQLRNLVLIKEGGLWIFKCGHLFHGACLNLIKIKLCPTCTMNTLSQYG